jgi:SnoaL-like domain
MTLDELACKIACHDQLVRLCLALDSGANSEAAAFFAEDAVIVAPTGAEIAGPAARAFIEGRSSAIATRHVMTNVMVSPIAADAAKALATIMVYRVQKADDDVLPRALPATPQAVGDLHVDFKKSAKGWQITRYQAVTVMEPVV